MSPIQQMLLGVGAVDTKTYVDDVFSTFLYKGTQSDKTITNKVDLSGEGGMVWIKNRSSTWSNNIFDTVRGVTKKLVSDTSAAEETNTETMKAFNTNGFQIGNNGAVNASGDDIVSFSWKKAPGFFDVVTWTGNGTARTISHSLNCIPGLILIKQYGSNTDWVVYHRNMHSSPEEYFAYFNEANAATNSPSGLWNDTAPTASVFSIGTNGLVNDTSGEYIAYIFAGGESTAATARSVSFDDGGGGGDYLSLSNDTEMSPGTGDFCIEAWVNPDSWSNLDGVVGHDSGGFELSASATKLIFKQTTGSTILEADQPEIGQWTHVAVTRSGTSLKMFFNGTQVDTATDSTNFTGTNNGFYIGAYAGAFDGKISNLRFVKGSAVYTTSFKTPTEPLTNITNTVLLCCNNSSTTGSTVTPGTITANVSPAASTDSPFDDPAGLVFGDAGDRGVIKCGSYVGNGSHTGPEINVGWELQWLLIKRASGGTGEWLLYDALRGISTGGPDGKLAPNTSDAEFSYDYLDLTSTGFKLNVDYSFLNNNNHTYIYVAIRRPDGYVGKPPELGTNVFNISAGQGATPGFLSAFTTDAKLAKNKGGVEDWYSSSRLTGGKYLITNGSNAEGSGGYEQWDMQTGQGNTWQSNYIGYLWKRHAGFDVVAYTGDGVVGKEIPHSLNKTPEMVWIKRRFHAGQWTVYHKGLNGGTNPEQYAIYVDSNGSEVDTSAMWNDTAPTSTAVTVGNHGYINEGVNDSYLMMLFASVDGISKLGYYSGTGSSHVITTGFQPRLLVFKETNAANSWFLFDSLRGMSGSEKLLRMNMDAAELTLSGTNITLQSTGFTLTGVTCNASGSKWIYYAHA